ncbi:MAG: hypothetical protein HYV34_00820 [Candidatus Kerfeldbacteria bacterium]|nr:hypothetical protein [Candidatus Kerfeldbacteria bacterium]
MTSQTTTQMTRFVAMIALTALFAVSLANLFIGRSDHSYGMGYPCPLMQDQSTMCPMNVAEHIAQWQQLFSAPVNTKDLLTLLASVFVLSIVLVREPNVESPPQQRAFRLRNRLSILFDPLRVALSRGILRPLFYGEAA